jgi:hypothetical protein
MNEVWQRSFANKDCSRILDGIDNVSSLLLMIADSENTDNETITNYTQVQNEICLSGFCQ